MAVFTFLLGLFLVLLALIGGILTFSLLLFCWHKRNIEEFKKKTGSKKKGRRQPLEDGDPEVIIVGAGIVGSALASSLSRDGRKVTVIERSMLPHKTFAGECLMPGGIKALNELGLGDCLGDVDGSCLEGLTVRDPVKQRTLHLTYAKKGTSFHHEKFVSSLRKAAQAEELCTFIEGTVLSLVEENGIIKGVEYRTKGEENKKVMRAQLVVLCDGGYSRLRNVNVGEKPQPKGHFVGFEHEGQLDTPGRLVMLVTDNGFAYVYGISPTTSRFIIDIEGPMPKQPKEYFKDLIKQFPEHLKSVLGKVIEEGTMRSIPTFRMPAGYYFQPGVLCIGDAFNMRHPLTASGMTVGLSDTVIWRDLLRQVDDLSDYDALYTAMKIFLVRRKIKCTVVSSVFADTLYAILTPRTEACKDLRHGFFEYLGLGGLCAKGPTEIIALTQTNPAVLYYHLVAATFYAMYVCLKMERPYTIPRGVFKALRVLHCALSILLPHTWTEIRTLFVHKR